MKVNFLDLKKQYKSIKPEIDQAIAAVIESTAFAGGPFVEEFEEEFAKAHGAVFCVGVNSGTAALHIALWALDIGPGDEVIVPANTFFATAEAVSLSGATPVFVDCELDYYHIDTSLIGNAITAKTKAIIPVHLYGQPAEIENICEIADKHNLVVIEDCAQAHLAGTAERKVGTFGKAGCFSSYPGKNLGAFGEAGCVITDDKDMYEKMMALRDHGSKRKYYHDYVGHNYRMAGLQGAVLNVKLKYLSDWTEQRQLAAEAYRKLLDGVEQVTLPKQRKNIDHSYHLFVVRVINRDQLSKYLQDRGVFTGIHYPVPCHLQKAYKSLGYPEGSMKVSETIADQILSLPMHEYIEQEEIEYVASVIKEFYIA